MTPEELAAAFSKRGYDTVEQIDGFIHGVDLTFQLRQKDIELEAIPAEKAAAAAPVENKRIQLVNERAAIAAELDQITIQK